MWVRPLKLLLEPCDARLGFAKLAKLLLSLPVLWSRRREADVRHARAYTLIVSAT